MREVEKKVREHGKDEIDVGHVEESRMKGKVGKWASGLEG